MERRRRILRHMDYRFKDQTTVERKAGCGTCGALLTWNPAPGPMNRRAYVADHCGARYLSRPVMARVVTREGVAR